MSKINPIVITDTRCGKEYTLEFNREAVRFAEGRGFNVAAFAESPVTHIEDIFYYAFRMHHPNVSREKANELFAQIGEPLPEGFVGRITELYNEPLLALMGSKDDEDAGEEKRNFPVKVSL